METTVLLSKVLGLYLILSGLIVLIRREYYLPVFSVFVKEKMIRIILAFIELFAGLFLVVAHFNFTTVPAFIISAFGCVAVLEGIMYATLPDTWFSKMMTQVNRPSVYIVGSLSSMIVGLYLASYGFGWM